MALLLLLLISLGIIWGSGYSIARYCMTHGVPPLGYAFWQSAGPAIFLTLLVLGRRLPFSFKPEYLRYYILCGLLGIALPNTLMYFASAHLPSGIIAVLVNTVPIWIYPLSLLLAQESFHKLRFLAVLIGVLGMVLMVHEGLQWPQTSHIPWILAILLVPLSFALCAVFIAAFRPVPSNSLSLSAGMLIVSTVCVAPWAVGTDNIYPFHWPLTQLNWLILLEIALSSTGYVILFSLLKRAGPVFYSLVGGVVSLTGLFWGMVIFQESLNFMTIVSIVCILGAIILMHLNLRKK